MVKIFIVSNFGVADGYGRIATEVAVRLQQRGYEIATAGIPYDGLLPAQYDGQTLPFWVSALNSRQDWPAVVSTLIGLHKPDMVMVIQDFPYAEAMRIQPLDWSKYAFIFITPVDGAPVFPSWLDVARKADGFLTISEFGVETFRQAGLHAGLCRPGINSRTFYVLPQDKRLGLRGKLNIEADAFVVGVMCQNQGRKSVPQAMKAFFDFASDKPNARLLLDMEKHGAWDLEALVKQNGWDASKVLYREDCAKAGVTELRERYNLLDAHAVLAFREGFGLPIIEAMACGAVSIAQDYCAGTEVLKDGRGILVPSVDYFYPSSWGNAEDRLPDYRAMAEKLRWLHDNPLERAAMAERGRIWSTQQSWDTATDNTLMVIEQALARHKAGVTEVTP